MTLLPAMTRRTRLIGICALVAIVIAGGLFFFNRPHGSGLTIPNNTCASPPPLTTSQGVTLQPVAMTAFKKAQHDAGTRIRTVASYRSCDAQAAACQNICGNPHGCPDLCAKPGDSYHQLGAAVDLSPSSLANTQIVSALEKNGWCQPLPDSDAGHFSFGGCH
jgi:hypothetical protein